MYRKRAEESALKTALSAVRNDLLDLSTKNPLLNNKASKTLGIPKIQLGSDEIFQHLVVNRNILSFYTGEASVSHALRGLGSISGSYFQVEDYLASNSSGPQQVITLQTGLEAVDLEARLLSTYYAAQSSIEGEGAITLFIAIGALRWVDDQGPGELFQAPLIMIPVQLTRNSVTSGFFLTYSGDDVLENVCLSESLRRQGIEMPSISDPIKLNVADYFGLVRRAIAQKTRWFVETDVVSLGLFSLSEILMYKDLDPVSWPTLGLLRNPMLANLITGVSLQSAEPSIDQDAFLDTYLAGVNPHHVMDADSSQARAILEVAKGESIVIQGPPGTGKSQTIVNIIADAIARNKTVLFVSEKRAALEVVRNRLQGVGLGQTILEFHSNRTSKNVIFEQLRKTLDLRFANPLETVPDYGALSAAQAQLNEYCDAVNSNANPTGESPYSVYGPLAKLTQLFSAMETPALELPDALTWNASKVSEIRGYVAKLQTALSSCQVPVDHPFWGTPWSPLSATAKDRLKLALQKATSRIEVLERSSHSLAVLLGAPLPSTLNETDHLLDLAITLEDAPMMQGVAVDSDVWQLHAEQILEAIISGERRAAILHKWHHAVRPDAWSKDPAELARELERGQSRWWGGPSKNSKEVAALLQSFLFNGYQMAADDIPLLIKDIADAQRYARRLDSQSRLLQKAFDQHWRGVLSDWPLLRSQANWISRVSSSHLANELPAWLRNLLTRGFNRIDIQQAVHGLSEAQSEYIGANRVVFSILFEETTDAALTILDCQNGNISGLKKAYETLTHRIHDLSPLLRYLAIRSECADHLPAGLLDIADSWSGGCTRLLDLFDYTRLSTFIDHAYRSNPSLNHFDGAAHTRNVEEFRRLDRISLIWARSVIAATHLKRIKQSTAHRSIFDTISSASEFRNGLPSIRSFMAELGDAVQLITPVFMMSPSSVATFLPPEQINFDMVIFDEASQLRPADALVAIARGSQVVVVGDSKQLPPTAYSSQQFHDGPDKQFQTLSDVESILGLFCSLGVGQHLLRWHYRSKHESLIAQSNQSFYNNKLIVFPSPDRRRIDVGLVSHHIAPKGKISSQRLEALAISKAVMARAAEQMEKPFVLRQSLGVATVSTKQRDLILKELETLRNERPEYEDFFIANQSEPFFVKDLENVQGDERDTIFISIGSGDIEGKVIPPALEPLLREGGERRLNVLFTRARRRCEVFTTLTSSDIVLSDRSPVGLVTFKKFLQYAEHGRLRRLATPDEISLSSLEMQVADSIERLGFTVQRQVGPSGFFLDLAVVDPHDPDRYLLGVLFDGPSYQQARSSRDRDRLREEALEDMGWTIIRIWSAAWFQNKPEEEKKILEALSVASGRSESFAVAVTL